MEGVESEPGANRPRSWYVVALVIGTASALSACGKSPVIERALDFLEASWAWITWVIALFIGLDYIGKKMRSLKRWVKYLLLGCIAASGPIAKVAFSLPWILALLVPTAIIVLAALGAALISGEVTLDQ